MSARVLVRDGGSLRFRLVALVLLPLIAATTFAGLRFGDSVSSARAAGRADAHVRSAAAIAVARGAFEQEILPAFAATVVHNPAVLSTLATAPELKAAVAITAQLPSLRRATDAAVAALAGHPSVVAAGRRFATQLASARAAMDNPALLTTALATATALSDSMAFVQGSQVEAATAEHLSRPVVQALQDAALVGVAARAAAEELALFTGTQFTEAGAPGGRDRQWAQGWAAFATASAAVSSQTSEPIAARWDSVNAAPAVAAFTAFLDSNLIPTGSISIVKTIGLIIEDGARNKAYAGVLGGALDRALAAGRAQQVGAEQELILITVAGLLVMALSVGIALWVRRSITGPLDLLATQASAISEGELIDVRVGGPREVRTVARALSSSVLSLRNIEAHAAAVAAGDLDNDAVNEPLPGPLGEVVHGSVARIIAAINDREAAQRALAHRAGHDALTELANRHQALVLISQALHRAHRAGAVTALMFVDLDYFKAVNDTFGHAAGDTVLQTVARRMLAVARRGDTVARLGGDEFVVLAEAINDEADMVRVAQRMIEQISLPIIVGADTVQVGASVGIAFCRDGYVDADRIMQEADAAAYRAKNSGRGRVDVFDDGLRTELRLRAETEHAIAAGLDRAEFVLYYQPVIDLVTGGTDSAEALIRWNRPGHGLLLPQEFIPVAERSTLIIDIGRWVLARATDQLAAWNRADARLGQLRVSVNISGRHLVSDRLIIDVTDALAHSGIEPARLILELTETVAIDTVSAIANLQTLRAMGVQIALDDFGTGLTSIGQLPTLPVDSLKIDRSFIAAPQATGQELVRLMVATAHVFGLTVVAEGIEEQDQADRLRAAGAQFGQGYLFARPQPPELIFPKLLPDESAEPTEPCEAR